MTTLTYREVLHLLECIKRAHGVGSGYITEPAEVGRLQAKLSVMLEVRASLGDDTTRAAIPFRGVYDEGHGMKRIQYVRHQVDVEITTDFEETEEGHHVAVTEARCTRCGHQVKAFGDGQRSIIRCCAMLREQCPNNGEHNWYEPS